MPSVTPQSCIMYFLPYMINISAEFDSKFITCIVIMQYELYVPLDNLPAHLLSCLTIDIDGNELASKDFMAVMCSSMHRADNGTRRPE